ncbi:ribosomal protein S18 acetylase RimI-like enzyme [Paenibacillus turicensis]|uniref:Ribosomal protein S18 acetylase RimI-like enzyme n=1 Tax=Paenibacillus turicensis TaxID=160487 RepID=A0ABS4FXH5_9BACL|nr:GNAT family N-acetyltransferase [Paenibacillus turicensis]MBP1907282.1 ribosomal protein S18 acetylase RimI-like enzyme [Paenibacillus turicensis]
MKHNILHLQHIVEQHDNLSLKLNWDMLEARDDNENSFYHLHEGQLVGFLALYPFGDKVEVCGMVHPDYRRQGIFTKLIKESITMKLEQQYKEILLNTPANSSSGVAFLRQIPCQLGYTEYQMKYYPLEKTAGTAQNDNHLNQSIKLDPYQPELHQHFFAQLDVDGFGESEDVAIEYYEKLSFIDQSQYFVVMKEDQAVGKIRISHESKDEVWLYGFVISAAMRGQGIGRVVLEHIVERESKLGVNVWLEVALNNDHARYLYESVGFQVQHEQSYYKWSRSFFYS